MLRFRPLGANQAVQRDATPRRRVRHVREQLEAGVHDVRQVGQDRQAVELREPVAAAVGGLCGRRGGRVVAPDRAVRGRGDGQPSGLLRRARGRAEAGEDVRPARLPSGQVQQRRSRVRRGRRRRQRARVQFDHVPDTVRARRRRVHGKYEMCRRTARKRFVGFLHEV